MLEAVPPMVVLYTKTIDTIRLYYHLNSSADSAVFLSDFVGGVQLFPS